MIEMLHRDFEPSTQLSKPPSVFQQQICDACDNIPLSAFVKGNHGLNRHLPGYQALLSSAEKCDFCRLMVNGLRAQFIIKCDAMLDHEQYIPGNLGQLDQAIIQEAYNEPFPVARGWVVIRGGVICVSSRAQCSLELYSLTDSVLDMHLDPFTKISDIPMLTRIHGTDLLHRARMICTGESLSNASPKSFPTRVIVIPEDILSTSLSVQELDPLMEGQYIALSHRWGSERHIMTTRSNVGKHSQAFNFYDLPKTFQDAVTVCQYMNIRYLWIDSLCIIQDDPDDWSRESARMAQVYSNAFCTIAAHTALHDNIGFLNATLDSTQGGVIFKNQVLVSLRGSFEWHAAWNSALSTRGWIVQERLLSKQVLHFAPSEIYWECGDSILSIAENSREVISTMTQLPPKLLVRSSLEERSVGIDINWWYHHVQWYSRCQLTEGMDKLPAIAGIVAEIQRTSTSKYFAGIWDFEIERGLLWHAAGGAILKRPQAKRAPSWSWASWDGPIRFPFLNRTHESGASSLLIDFPEEDDTTLSLEAFFRQKPRNEALPGAFPEAEDDIEDEFTNRFSSLQLGVQLTEVQASTYEQIDDLESSGLYNFQGYRVLGKIDGPRQKWVSMDEEGSIFPQERLWFALIGTMENFYVGLFVAKDNSEDENYRRIGVGGYERVKLCSEKYRIITIV